MTGSVQVVLEQDGDDMVLCIPPEVITAVGWDDVTEVSLEVDAQGCLIITRV